MTAQNMAKTIESIASKGRGILAADESTPTITKRFSSIKIESTIESHRQYRQMLFTTEKLSDFISGVILYEETLKQKTDDGVPFPTFLSQNNIVPGIKVDKGTIPLPGSPNEKITQGLDGLGERLQEYKSLGAQFAKWRAVLPITDEYPSHYAMHANAEALARYAALCQANDIVPIVEPELLMDGDHSLARCAEATERTLRKVFSALAMHRVQLEYIILKPNMVVAGLDHKPQPSIEQVAEATITVLKRVVPAAVPTINFLSGGQSDVLATEHLNAMNKQTLPWHLSFSYGRALQAPALTTWAGKSENNQAAQRVLYQRAKLNSAATLGQYAHGMES